MTIRTDTEHEARQLAARYLAERTVGIVAGSFRGKECCFLETGDDRSLVRSKELLLFEGKGKDAGPIDPPLAFTDKPVWKRGLWLRRAVNLDSTTSTQVLEWDGLGETPDVELGNEGALEVAWLGPLPPLPF